MAATPVPGYETTAVGGRRLAIVLACGVVLDFVAVLGSALERSLLERRIAGESVGEGLNGANDAVQAVVGVAQAVVFLATVVLWLVWFDRAYNNLPPLGARGLRFGRLWAAAGWFVPIANLFRPKQIANDIWRGSDPHAARDQSEVWRERPVPWFFLLWWLAWLATEVAFVVSFRLGGSEPAEMREAATTSIFANALGVIAGGAAFVVVRASTARQRDRAHVLDLE